MLGIIAEKSILGSHSGQQQCNKQQTERNPLKEINKDIKGYQGVIQYEPQISHEKNYYNSKPSYPYNIQ